MVTQLSLVKHTENILLAKIYENLSLKWVGGNSSLIIIQIPFKLHTLEMTVLTENKVPLKVKFW